MPPVAKKAAAPKPKAEEPTDEVKSDLPDDDKDSDTPQDVDNAPDNTEGDASVASIEDEGVWVAEPCAKCFPDGWPSTEPGASVNCPHNHALVFGDSVQISKERAEELGFDVSS